MKDRVELVMESIADLSFADCRAVLLEALDELTKAETAAAVDQSADAPADPTILDGGDNQS